MPHDPIEHADVHAFIRGRLSQSDQSMTAVANATGISKRWLEMMRAGEIDKPGLPHLERLAAHYGYRIEVTRVHADTSVESDANA